MSVCNVTLAIPRNYKNSEGIYETDFLTCVCYKNNAERIAEWCEKGDLIGVKGIVQSRTYEKDGKKIYTNEFIVDSINFLSTNKSKNNVKETPQAKENNKENDPCEDFSNEADLRELSQTELPF